jgi:hypothetical protein
VCPDLLYGVKHRGPPASGPPSRTRTRESERYSPTRFVRQAARANRPSPIRSPVFYRPTSGALVRPANRNGEGPDARLLRAVPASASNPSQPCLGRPRAATRPRPTEHEQLVRPRHPTRLLSWRWPVFFCRTSSARSGATIPAGGKPGGGTSTPCARSSRLGAGSDKAIRSRARARGAVQTGIGCAGARGGPDGDRALRSVPDNFANALIRGRTSCGIAPSKSTEVHCRLPQSRSMLWVRLWAARQLYEKTLYF